MFGEIRQKFREQGAKRVKFSPYSEETISGNLGFCSLSGIEKRIIHSFHK